MIDVFYCEYQADHFRDLLAAPCLARWYQMCHPILVRPWPWEEVSKEKFQGWRRQFAEDNAKTDLYIIADDDCMPLGANFIERAEDVMRRHPEFAVLGATDYALPYSPDEVTEIGTAGGINVIRRGVIKVGEVVPWTSAQQREQVYKAGYRVGRMRDVRMNHFGEGFSTVWPKGYTGHTQVGYLGKEGALV